MHKFLLGPLVVLAVIAGCAVGPDYVEPETALADGFIEASSDVFDAATIRANLWGSFDDPDLDVTAKDVLVLRNAGPKGAPGMPEAPPERPVEHHAQPQPDGRVGGVVEVEEPRRHSVVPAPGQAEVRALQGDPVGARREDGGW